MAEAKTHINVVVKTNLTFSCYSCQYEYWLPDKVDVTQTTITYTAASGAEAVLASLRFWKSRERMPDLFGPLLYLQIHPMTIGGIDEKGSLTGRKSFRLLEWSRDRAGVDLETYVQWKVAEYTKRDLEAAKQRAISST